MRFTILKILSRQVLISTLKNKSTIVLIGIFNILIIAALFSGYSAFRQQQASVKDHSHEVRERWENNPDKHPHRMAHYGYVVFRQKFPLSFFDFGMDSYLGNAVFLEAHRQNTVNFSEASLSNGLLRFGEISAGMILQVLLPLLLFFWGFDLIARERENGTLRILLTQGISWPELIVGKALGLFYLSLSIFTPAIVIGFILLASNNSGLHNSQAFGQFSVLITSYLVYLSIISLLAVYVSAQSSSSKAALIKLIGCWLVFTLILPKISQVAGQSLFPSPSKIAFDTKVEEELISQGDSHNPNDPHYKALKDSLLRAYNVDSTHKLPFNYGGYVMREGERLSAEVYNRHQEKLVSIYQQQQNAVRLTALINPFLAIKNLSMALAGTDYNTYNDFQNQVEAYRYKQAQAMNELQIKLISNKIKSSSDKSSAVSSQYWKDFPDFDYHFLSFTQVFGKEIIAIISLIIWVVGLFFLIKTTSTHLKAF
ncbi:ABC transporter permease [Emticicia soli]|uniref:ABC transporter permease n=1 Tax=Emticicia soli TaxID=2027878 RepID=A0ABW5J4W9_9BACT